MKSIDIQIALITLDQKLKELIRKKGPTEISEHCKDMKGCRKQHISAYVKNKINWSWKKVLDVADKVGL